MSIPLSREHGLNPSITKCFYCLEDDAIALFGARYPGGGEAPMNIGVINMEPCRKCEDLMRQGILLISIRDGDGEKIEPERQRALREYENEVRKHAPSWKKSHPFNFIPNPYRTGGLCVVREEAFTGVFGSSGPINQQVLKQRWTYIEDTVWDSVGLPRNEHIDNRETGSANIGTLLTIIAWLLTISILLAITAFLLDVFDINVIRQVYEDGSFVIKLIGCLPWAACY